MLEFDEFLKVIKGGQKGAGSSSKHNDGKADSSGKIYKFFKGLSSGE